MADPGPPTRTFTLRDAMLLVAAAGVGALGYRSGAAAMAENGFAWIEELRVEGTATLVGPGLAALTAALAFMRLIPPRPARVELFRQPGFAAACVAMTLTSSWFAWQSFRDRLQWFDDWWLGVEWLEVIQGSATGILVAWATLALAGCWKAERGWIDRSLRAVAVVWVLAGLGSRAATLVILYGST